MNINATLIVQAFNFFIAYLLFRIFLLKPAHAAIKQDEAATDTLHGAIAHSKKKLEKKEQERAQLWQDSQGYFAKNQPAAPSAEQLVFRNIAPPAAYPLLSDEQVAQAVRETMHGIIKKVGQVR